MELRETRNQMETRETRNQMGTPGTEDLNNNRYANNRRDASNSRDVSNSCLQALQEQKEHRQLVGSTAAAE
jgi:hypothetical protein